MDICKVVVAQHVNAMFDCTIAVIVIVIVALSNTDSTVQRVTVEMPLASV